MPRKHVTPTSIPDVLKSLKGLAAERYENNESIFKGVCKFYNTDFINAVKKAFPGTRECGHNMLGMETLAIPGSHPQFPVAEVASANGITLGGGKPR